MSSIRYKCLTSSATPFRKAHDSDAAFDIYSDIDVSIYPGENALVSTGIALDMEDHYATVLSRSGLAKERIFVLNAPGLIDTGYKGEIKVILQNLGGNAYSVERGDRIAQIMFHRNYDVYLEETDSLSSSDRGEGGFGSSGKK